VRARRSAPAGTGTQRARNGHATGTFTFSVSAILPATPVCSTGKRAMKPSCFTAMSTLA
jgi:hypothetical protein